MLKFSDHNEILNINVHILFILKYVNVYICIYIPFCRYCTLI